MGGRDIEVTNENKRLYVQAVIDYICGGAAEDQMGAICSGIYELVPKTYLANSTADEIKLLVNGKPIVNPKEIREGGRYTGGYKTRQFTL